jgi:gliding motility-associated-like protein
MASFGNCEVENSITISGRTDLNVSVNDDFKSCVGEEWTLTANTSEEEVNYQWYLNEDLIVGETNSTITFVVGDNFSGNENYSVVISRGTCLGTDDVNIELYNVSNCVITQGISPDATPEFNDYLDLEFLSDRVGGITTLQIFNRYGTIVFNKNNYINEWKGQDKNGNDLPTGTYYYVIDFASTDDVYGDQTSGWIYLNRTGN